MSRLPNNSPALAGAILGTMFKWAVTATAVFAAWTYSRTEEPEETQKSKGCCPSTSVTLHLMPPCPVHRQRIVMCVGGGG